MLRLVRPGGVGHHRTTEHNQISQVVTNGALAFIRVGDQAQRPDGYAGQMVAKLANFFNVGRARAMQVGQVQIQCVGMCAPAEGGVTHIAFAHQFGNLGGFGQIN